MIKLWRKFRRWIGVPAVDLELRVPCALIADLDFVLMDMVIRRDVEYWLNEVVGVTHWQSNIGSFYDDGLDSPTILKFRYAQDLELFKTNWF